MTSRVADCRVHVSTPAYFGAQLSVPGSTSLSQGAVERACRRRCFRCCPRGRISSFLGEDQSALNHYESLFPPHWFQIGQVASALATQKFRFTDQLTCLETAIVQKTHLLSFHSRILVVVSALKGVTNA